MRNTIRRPAGSGLACLTVLLLLPAPSGASPRLSATQRRTLALQVELDRAHFSPGEIDAADGANTRRALAAYRQARGKDAAPPEPPLTSYTITEEDAKGPFTPLPDDIMERATLPALSYESLAEALAERFHASPALLRALNPGKELRPGETIEVPNVAREPLPAASRLVIDASDGGLQVFDEGGKVVARYPVSAGTEHDPLPIGSWTVKTKVERPAFFYNPDLFWDADESHSKAKIAAGPNNPVGLVWIDLSKEHYGLHGTPEPSAVGKTQSHGCIRLTNWDAQSLYAAVVRGTPVEMQE